MVSSSYAVADPVLKVDHLTMRFGGLTAIDNLSFEVGRNDITALIGPNGAGKTTVFNCLTGFYKPTEGRISMGHKPGSFAMIEEHTTGGQRFDKDAGLYFLERMQDIEIASTAKVARTFQNIRLFGGMTLLENLMVAQHNRLMLDSGFTVAGLLGLPSYHKGNRQALAKARHWLEMTKLIDRADDPAADLPYGDQRRLEIARAMCTGPKVLCLDEPAAGLNPKESAELNQLLLDTRDRENIAVLLIEHDMSVVMEISDHVVVLDYGQKISDGSATSVQSDPKVIAAYLGVDDSEVDSVEAEVGVTHVNKEVSEGELAAKPVAKAAAPKKGPVKTSTARKPVAKKAAAKKAVPKKAAAKAKSTKSKGAKK